MAETRRGRAHGDTRARIIEAAYRTLAEQGYEATTVKEIARAAEVAPGLVHYYFRDKDELLATVLREMAERRLTQDARNRALLAPREAIARALALAQRRVTEEPGWYRLRYEFFALGLRNAAMTPGVAELLANGRQGVQAFTAHDSDPDAARDAEALAAILLGALDGLALQKLVDPDFDLDHAYHTLSELIEREIIH